MIEIRQSTVQEFFEISGTLFEEHWEEIALNKRVMVLKPDWERYRTMEATGLLLILAAFDANEMVGYSVNFVMRHLHYADLCICHNDILFVTRSKRAGKLGLQLIRETEKAAKAKGTQMMSWHAKPDTALHAIMPRLGYGVQDIIYSKEI